MTSTVHEHVFDELPALLTGELDRRTTSRVSAHLRVCDDCRQDLVLVVTASAALRSAVRFAPESFTSTGVTLPDPTKLLAEITGGGEAGASDAGTAASESASEPHPPDADAGQPTAATSSAGALARVLSQGRRRGWWSAVAAAVLLLIGSGVGVLVNRHNIGPAAPTRQIALEPVGVWTGTGTATLSGGTLSIDPKNLKTATPGHFYEVWLVSARDSQSKLLPVGVLSANGPNEYRLSPQMVAEYRSVEVSFEPDDGNPAYSGISVMRGQYG